jgi:succinoglycan biosynthesis transport protein ExoP
MSVAPLYPPVADDELDLRQLAAALCRHWRLIAAGAGMGLLVSGLATLGQKRVWEGEFQIVLAKQQGGAGRLASLAAANPMLANIAGLDGAGGADSLETEVKILESPSVLKPVFDYVRLEKQRAGTNVDRLRFAEWLKDNLEIKLEKGTSVLNIAYRDTDQALVLPVIRRISSTYQSYSGRDRQRDLSQGVAYLDEQVARLRPQANASMRAAQAYALTHGLGLQDGFPAAAAGDAGAASTPSGSVEGSREAAQNRVNQLRQQLAAARQAGSSAVYQAPELKANAELYAQLQELEARLVEKSALLRPNDEMIQQLRRQRAGLVAYINQQTAGLLQGQLTGAEATLASLSRPREVLLKHRELVRQALLDEKTMAELETQLRASRLEKARQTDPWELISTPTLLDRPVSPRPARNLALGLLAGLVAGSAAALVADRRSGLVFSSEDLQAALPYPLLAQLPDEPEAWPAILQLLADGPLAGARSVALIPVGALDPSALVVEANLRQLLPESTSLQTCHTLHEAAFCQRQLLLASPGVVSRTHLQQLQQNLQLQGKPVTGVVLL